MEKVGMSNQTKRLHEAYIEAKNTMATLRAKIKTLEPFYQRAKALYDHARLAELKNMDYELYLKTEEWQRTRLDAIERARGVCEKCGSNESLQVHHLTYERRGEELPEDLIVLCDKCHEKEHKLTSERKDEKMDDILMSDFQQTIAALQEKNATLRAEVARLREALGKIKLESEYSIAYGRSDALNQLESEE